MTSLVGKKYTEGLHAGEFIVSEATRGATGVARGRRAGVVVMNAATNTNTVPVGRVMMRVGDKWQSYDGSTSTAAGILFAEVDATAADADAVILAADFEYSIDMVSWQDMVTETDLTPVQIVTGMAELEALGIIGR